MGNKILITLAIASSIAFCSCANNNSPKNNLGNNAKTLSTLNNITDVNLLSKNNVLIDVRTPEEFAEGHLPHAINIDVKSLDFDEKIKQLNITTNYYIYCRSGVRSKLATEKMLEKGIKNTHNFLDGIATYNGKIEK